MRSARRAFAGTFGGRGPGAFTNNAGRNYANFGPASIRRGFCRRFWWPWLWESGKQFRGKFRRLRLGKFRQQFQRKPRQLRPGEYLAELPPGLAGEILCGLSLRPGLRPAQRPAGRGGRGTFADIFGGRGSGNSGGNSASFGSGNFASNPRGNSADFGPANARRSFCRRFRRPWLRKFGRQLWEETPPTLARGNLAGALAGNFAAK